MNATSNPGKSNILVCIKFVPDPAQLLVDSSTGRPDLKRTPIRISTFDENAIEAALQVAAQDGGRVVATSICASTPPRDVLLKALAMGVAGVYLIKDEERLVQDTLRVATVLARAAQTISARDGESQWDLIICGEASADQYNQQVGPRLATALSLPCVTYATSLVLNNGTLRAERGIEQRLETLQLPTPAVVTVGTEINVARMPTVLQIMGAGRKPVVELALRDLVGMDIERLKALPSIEDVDVFAPPSARKQITIKGESTDDIVRELLRRLGSDGEVTF